MTNAIVVPDPRALIDEGAAEPVVHHAPLGFSDRFALSFTKLLDAEPVRADHSTPGNGSPSTFALCGVTA